MTHQLISGRLRQPLALLLALSLLLTACGESGDDTDADSNQAGAQPTATTMIDPTAPEEALDADPDEEPVNPATPEAPDDAEPVEPPSEPDATASPELPAATEPADPESPAGEEPQEQPAEPENPAPEIGTIDAWYNGGATSLAELRGSPVLLVFWADY